MESEKVGNQNSRTVCLPEEVLLESRRFAQHSQIKAVWRKVAVTLIESVEWIHTALCKEPHDSLAWRHKWSHSTSIHNPVSIKMWETLTGSHPHSPPGRSLTASCCPWLLVEWIKTRRVTYGWHLTEWWVTPYQRPWEIQLCLYTTHSWWRC